ncbi:hypothetical protein H0H93_012300 [Arthromyces matolae]|nr:hypothetical protein H0H93_012300 [Arthromyces matolae]
MKGLKPSVKDGLVPIVNRPKTLQGWEPIVIAIDNNLHQRELERRSESENSSSRNFTSNPVSTPLTAPSTSTLPTATPNSFDSDSTTFNTQVTTSTDSVPADSATDDTAMDIDALRNASSSSARRSSVPSTTQTQVCEHCRGSGKASA